LCCCLQIRTSFDRVGTAASDLAASERFYRTVLSVLGVAHPADADLIGREDCDIGATDRVHPVLRGLDVGFRARDRAQVDAFWHAGIDARYRNGARAAHAIPPNLLPHLSARPGRRNSVEAVHGDREDAVPRPDRLPARGLGLRTCRTTGTRRRSVSGVAGANCLQLRTFTEGGRCVPHCRSLRAFPS
jgi:hypothetical protein